MEERGEQQIERIARRDKDKERKWDKIFIIFASFD
jgi:hypothetical protein